MRYVLLALTLAATAARAEWQPPTMAETTLLIAAQTSSVLDMLQTLDIKRHPEQLYEINPLLGEHPSDARVLTYFAASAVIKTAAWYALPRGWRNIVPLLNLAVEIPLIAHNANVGLQIRF